MPLIDNPMNYDDKVPTNIRLIKELKDRAIAEAEEKGVNMADIVNEALKERYKDKK